MDNIDIKFLDSQHRSVAYNGDKEVGECTFIADNNKWIINHTGVISEYEGKGIARKLLLEIVNQARKKGIKIQPVCSYAQRVLVEKEEYKDVLV